MRTVFITILISIFIICACTPSQMIETAASVASTEDFTFSNTGMSQPTITLSYTEEAIITTKTFDKEDALTFLEWAGSSENLDNLVLAPVDVFNNFLNKTIPTEVELRYDNSDELARIGGAVVSDDSHQTAAKIQMVLLGGFTNEDMAYLIFGTEDSLTGERIIVPVQFTFSLEGSCSTVQVGEDTNQIKMMDYSYENMETLDALELLDRVKENLGKVVVVQLELKYKLERPNREFIAVVEKFKLFERWALNILLVNNPSNLNVSNLKECPWAGLIIF